MKPGHAKLLKVVAALLVVGGAVAVWTLVVRGGAENRLVSHLEAMVDLLDQHKGAPDEAAAAVERYVEENRAELVALRAELEQQRASLAPQEVADLAGDLLRKSGPVMERAHRLMREHPGLASNERLRKALESLTR